MFQSLSSLLTSRSDDKKLACRSGLDPSARSKNWLDLAVTIGDIKKSEAEANDPLHKEQLLREKERREHYFRAALREVFGNLDPLPGKIFRLAFLGVEPAILPEEATVLLAQPSIAVSAAHDRVISVLAQLHSLRYCPQVPNLALILLSYLSESDTFAAVESLLSHNKSIPMLILSKREETAFIKTFRTLVKSYFPQLSAHLEGLGGPVRAVYASWFRGFFTGWLPTEDVHKVVDSYLHEGPKVLIRYGLALLKILKRRLKATPSASDIDRVFRRWVARAVVKRHLTTSNSAALANIPPHLLSELSSSSSGGGSGSAEELPEYSFELLRDTAFDGISGLSRATIQKLMDKYAGPSAAPSSSSSAAAAAAAAGASGTGSGTASGVASAASFTRSRLNSDGGGDHIITVPSQNAILTVGHSTASPAGSMSGRGPASLAAAAAAVAGHSSESSTSYLGAQGAALIHAKETARTAGSYSGYDVTENGVIYDRIGLDPEDAPGSASSSSSSGSASGAVVGVWSNPKIVGIGTRLMTPDFSPCEAMLFIGQIRAAHKRLHRDMYCPPALQLLQQQQQQGDDAFVTARGGATSSSGGYGFSNNNNSYSGTIVRTAGWIEGLKGHLGLAPDQSIGAISTIAEPFVPSYGHNAAAGHGGGGTNKPSIADIFGSRVAHPSSATASTASGGAAGAGSGGVKEGSGAVPRLHLPGGNGSARDSDHIGVADDDTARAAALAPGLEDGSTPVVTKAPGTGRLGNSSDIVAAFSVASSPHLASLCTLLPSQVSTLNWACLYSSDVHGSSLATLYANTSGFAPVMVFIQAQVHVNSSSASAGGVGAGGDGTTTSATASKLATAVSSKRPVFGFFASRGLRHSSLLLNDNVSTVGSTGSTEVRRGSGTGRNDTTYGGRNDFLFQLYPEVSLFPVSNAETEVVPSESYAQASSHSDLVGTGHRTVLARDSFLTCLPDYLCVGGIPGKAGSHALRLPKDLDGAVASKSFLLDMSVPLPASSASSSDGLEEVPLDILAVEVYAFLDRQGNFQETKERSSAVDAALFHAKRLYLRNLQRYWENGEREIVKERNLAEAAAKGVQTVAPATARA